MITYILLALLALLFVGNIIVDILKKKRHQEHINNLMDIIEYMKDQNDNLNKEIAEVNLKFSGSLDTREKNYNDIFMQYKKAQLDLDAALQEIERLKDTNRVLAAINDGLKGGKDEKEEVKKED